MGWWQARAPIEGAVKVGTIEPTVKSSQQTTKLAVETNREKRVSQDANTNHDDRADVPIEKPTNKPQAKKAVPEPIEKSNFKSNEFKPNAIMSVEPASSREDEEVKGTTRQEDKVAVEQKRSPPPQPENQK